MLWASCEIQSIFSSLINNDIVFQKHLSSHKHDYKQLYNMSFRSFKSRNMSFYFILFLLILCINIICSFNVYFFSCLISSLISLLTIWVEFWSKIYVIYVILKAIFLMNLSFSNKATSATLLTCSMKDSLYIELIKVLLTFFNKYVWSVILKALFIMIYIHIKFNENIKWNSFIQIWIKLNISKQRWFDSSI